jgi:hypothetical protein
MKPATVVYRDPALEHQIVLGYQWRPGGAGISVSCNCRRVPGTAGVYMPLEVRERWEPGQALAVYGKHLPRNGHTP